ncbi:MAG: aldehyde ferredoxin oxidoreductase C-terminal domain-containing protein [Candidatus Bipolaricaulota bacterium]
MDRVIRVNARLGTIAATPVSEETRAWGGRQTIAEVLTRETSPLSDPLGRGNALVFAPGWLGGTAVTTSGRLSVGAKSPLTGGIKEANVGGEAGQKLARLGVHALILEDAPDAPAARGLYVGPHGARWIEDLSLAGRTVGETFRVLRERFGETCGILAIGPAGEFRMGAAGVATTDASGTQIRYAARGGLGAVMGAKGVKAIVLDDGGAAADRGADPARLAEAARRYATALINDPKAQGMSKQGTSAIVGTANELGLLPTRNFREGRFEAADALQGARLAELVAERGGRGRTGVPCMTGCVIRCSNVFPDPGGEIAVASLQYETIALLGSNCGVATLDGVAHLNALCNDLGLDTIEMGCVLGVAMEAGLAAFGDVEAAADLLTQTAKGTPLGRILGQGVVFAGRALGVRRIPAVNGQGIPGYDPRAMKGNGVTYVTSPMGADHTAGNAFGTWKAIDPLSGAGQIANSRGLQVRAAILDMAGLCLFARAPFVAEPELLADLVSGRLGRDVSFSDIVTAAAHTLTLERDFNQRAGRSDAFCDVPEFMRFEPLPPHNTVFDIGHDEMMRIWDIEPDRKGF